MAEERERDNPANDPEAARSSGKKGFLNKEWLKKHWIELVAAGAGLVGVLFLFMRGSGSSSSAAPIPQTSVPTTAPASSNGSSGSATPVDLSPITDALAQLGTQEQATLQAMQNIGNQDSATQQALAAELAAIQAQIAGLNGTGTAGSSTGSFPNTINPIPGGSIAPGPVYFPGDPTPQYNVTTHPVTGVPIAGSSPLGQVGSGTPPPSIPTAMSNFPPVVVPIPSNPTGTQGQLPTPPQPPPSPPVSPISPGPETPRLPGTGGAATPS